jgi:hypothetical protein
MSYNVRDWYENKHYYVPSLKVAPTTGGRDAQYIVRGAFESSSKELRQQMPELFAKVDEILTQPKKGRRGRKGHQPQSKSDPGQQES